MARPRRRGAVALEEPPPGVPVQEERPPAVHPRVFRRRRVIALVVLVLVLAGLGVGARVLIHDAGLFDVEGVSVTGTVTLSPDEVIAAAAVARGVPLADVDTAAVAARVAALPAVATAWAEQAWPHTVAVTVVERVPVGVVATGRGDALVDTTGAVYAGEAPPGLPRFDISGAGPDDPATRAAVAALGDLPPSVRAELQTVDATASAGSTQVTFELTKNRRVRWGSPDRGPDKAAVLVPLLAQPGHVFDVASPDLPTVTR
ncbi:FtsQ-type POTRA domain-containing protein [Pseudonocardia sp. CA-107938]|uniref:FtsQ-type POTRA domain-containing protein n=1 Tax=Pseudonocardia sp. CA-107938 TaxID=3240021 RepID=UPI003D8FBE3F